MKAKINVRQPLAKLSVKSAVSESLVDIIKDEVNVKEVVMDVALGEEVVLDTALTPELKEEGTIRELIRAIQDLRKEKGLTIQDRAILTLETDPKVQELIMKNKEMLSSTTLLKEIKFGNVEGEAKMVGELSLKIDVSK
jgi:isoleucyl-tRNA synthetase